METEELDQIFRAKLETLEEVPGLDWKEAGAWPKVKTRMSSGWGLGGLISLAGLVSIVAWVLYLQISEKEPVVVDHVVTKDSVFWTIKEPTKTEQLTKVRKPNRFKVSANTERRLRQSGDTVAQKTIDLPKVNLNIWQTKPRAYMLIDPRLDINRTKASVLSHSVYFPLLKSREPVFQMPSQRVLSLQIDNAFNLHNAFKIYETFKEQGIDYQYSYKYRPYSYGELRPFRSQHPTQIFINEYNNKRYEE